MVIQMDGRAPSHYRNNITLGGLHWQIDRWLPIAPPGLTHIAVGDGTAPVEPGNTALVSERARKAIASQVRDGEMLLAEAFFDRQDANFGWKEAGLFAGGSDASGSGVLVARALIEEAKDELRTATVTWQWEVASA